MVLSIPPDQSSQGFLGLKQAAMQSCVKQRVICWTLSYIGRIANYKGFTFWCLVLNCLYSLCDSRSITLTSPRSSAVHKKLFLSFIPIFKRSQQPGYAIYTRAWRLLTLTVLISSPQNSYSRDASLKIIFVFRISNTRTCAMPPKENNNQFGSSSL